ncbi:hypothetical protein AAEO56_15990 [Flavobacterium sp. DGU11]|uniref:Uncharacterized protein n=1 Tax=Flavobacterium arundinis TaxID=3139143 RepID=A0ABU9I023_9FLAO
MKAFWIFGGILGALIVAAFSDEKDEKVVKFGTGESDDYLRGFEDGKNY